MSSAAEAQVLEGGRASIAVDLGAESCRVSLLRWIDGRPRGSLVHRFANGPLQLATGLHWPLAEIEAGIDEGMRRCAAVAPEGIRSVAVDGWAVDYVRLDEAGRPLLPPFCYRDERAEAAMVELHGRISAERMREITGVQQLSINTVYQLYADTMQGLEPGHRWLNLPEYMLHRWGADPVAEYTNATHTQMVELKSGAWSKEIFSAAGVDLRKAPRLVKPGTVVGQLGGALTELPAFHDTLLIAPACHDTASAVAGIPAAGEDWAYISSGTWSLVGTRCSSPTNTPETRRENFTNLGAVGGYCFHKNVNGMWLLKQCMDSWSADGKTWEIEKLLQAAGSAADVKGLLDVDEHDLLQMGRMPQRINAQRKRQGLPKLNESPADAPVMVRLILRSLAARYAETLASVQQHTGKRLKRLFIVGGGSRNALLNRMTAEATGLHVICGAQESSTIGNLAIQLAVLEGVSAASPGFADAVARWAERLHPVEETVCGSWRT